MTTCEIPTVTLSSSDRTGRSVRSIRSARADRPAKVRAARRRPANPLRALRLILDGWTRRPSDEVLSGLAARDRIGERY